MDESAKVTIQIHGSCFKLFDLLTGNGWSVDLTVRQDEYDRFLESRMNADMHEDDEDKVEFSEKNAICAQCDWECKIEKCACDEKED